VLHFPRLRGHKGNVTDCCFMSTHNVLITRFGLFVFHCWGNFPSSRFSSFVSSKDSLVKLWDLDTQHCFQTLVGHRSEVWRRNRRGGRAEWREGREGEDERKGERKGSKEE